MKLGIGSTGLKIRFLCSHSFPLVTITLAFTELQRTVGKAQIDQGIINIADLPYLFTYQERSFPGRPPGSPLRYQYHVMARLQRDSV
jgi:hypothetical protein